MTPRERRAKRKSLKEKAKEPLVKVEFSKLLIIAVFVAATFVILYSAFAMFHLGDLSALPALIAAVFAEVAAATAFYYWKAKHENMIKLRAYYPQAGIHNDPATGAPVIPQTQVNVSTAPVEPAAEEPPVPYDPEGK